MTESAAGPPRRILVVDDEPALRDLTSASLKRAGHHVDSAKDGAEAWEILQQNGYDLLVTDYNMPGLLGTELIKNLRAAGIRLPAILVTGSLPSDEFSHHPWPQPEATLLKPFIFADLLDAVRTVLSAHAPHTGEPAGSPTPPIAAEGGGKRSSKP